MTDQPTEGQPPADDPTVAAGDESDESTEQAVESATGDEATEASTEEPSTEVAAAAAAEAPAPAPAAAAAPVAHRAGPVDPPYVAAAKLRKRVPLWAVPIFPLLLLWALIYPNAMQTPANTHDPVLQGRAIYAGPQACSFCHAADGSGATGPAFTNGALLKQFPSWEDQVRWVDIGAQNWQGSTYGTDGTIPPANKLMPGFGPDGNDQSLSCAKIVQVVYYERTQLGGETAANGGKDFAALTKIATEIASGNTSVDIPSCSPQTSTTAAANATP